MNRITAARTRLDNATDLASVLDAAYDAFEDIMAVLRHHEERAGGAFPAFVLAAGTAGNGRDWVAGAPSLPPAAGPRRPAAEQDLLAGQHWVQVAVDVAGLGHELCARLSRAAATAADPEDRTSCQSAAFYAHRIHALLAGARQP